MSFDTGFYARFDSVSSNEWGGLEGIQDAEDLTSLEQFWSEDPGFSEEEKHSAFRAIVDGEIRDPGSLRGWVIRLRALILLSEVSSRAVGEYVQSAAGEQFVMSLSGLRLEVYGDSMYGEAGRRTTDLLESHVLDIPLDELETGDTRNLREVLLEVEMLGDDNAGAALMQRVRVEVDGASPASPELTPRVANFCKNAADVYTWLYLLDLRAPGAVEVIAAYWEDTLVGRGDEEEDQDDDDNATARTPALADRVEVVVERALLNEYDEYASRYGLGLEQWEDWCQDAIAFLRTLQVGTRPRTDPRTPPRPD